MPWEKVGYKFKELYEQLDPEFLISDSHGFDEMKIHQRKNESLKAKDGHLYMDFLDSMENLNPGKNRRVYLATGSYGTAMFDKKDNVAMAWLKDGNVRALAGYCKQEWHEQAGWGSWKFWMTTPGRYTFAEAIFMNMQFILSRLNDWSPRLLDINYPECWDINADYEKTVAKIAAATGLKMVSLNQMGYLYDRNVFAYFGDPKWDARLEKVPETNHFKVSTERKGKKYLVTICTDNEFKRQQMSGNYYMEKPTMFNAATIWRLPFSYFFPERLKNPRLGKKLKFEGDLELDENFMFIHNCYFEPNQTYKIVLYTN